jgi:hypothetical protein
VTANELDAQHRATISLALGTNASNVRTGSATVNLSIGNSAPAASADLNYTLGGVTGSGTRTAGAGSSAATGSYTAVTGANSFSITASDSNATNSGQSVAFSQTGYDYAKPTYSNTLAMGNVHVGDTKTLSVANTTVNNASYQDSLDVIATNGGNSNLGVSGSMNIAAGNSGNITYTANSAGSLGATSSLGLTSNANGVTGLSNSTLGDGSVSVTGAAYNLAAADASQTVNVGITHVGQAKTVGVTLANTAPTNATYTETLSSNGFSSTSTNFTATGSVTGIAGGGTGSGSLAVGLSAGLSAGQYSGSTTLALNSNAVNNSGLGTTGVGTQTIALSGQVNEYAQPVLQQNAGDPGAGTLTKLTDTSYLLNLGTYDVNTGVYTANLNALNSFLSTYQDTLSGSVDTSTLTHFIFTGSNTFSDIAAGQTSNTFGFEFNTDGKSSGIYTDTVAFAFSSGNTSSSTALDSSSIQLEVQVVPEPSTWAMLVGGIGMLGFVRRLRARF